MQASSSAPAPHPHQNAPKPGPTVVPPREPEKRRTALWGVLAAVVLVGGGAAYYWNSTSQQRTGAGGLITVPTVAVALGDLHSTIRVNGSVAAENSQALLAPRIMGSRGDFNRGGDGGGRQGGGGGGGMGGGATGGGGSSMGGGGGSMMGGGGPGGDFQLVLMSLAKAGTRIKQGDVVAQFDPQNQMHRLDDYKDMVVQLENTIRKSMANLAAAKEAQDQQVRTAKAEWDRAVLDLKTEKVRSAIDAEKFKLAVEEAELKYQTLVAQSKLVDESQRAAIRASELTRDQSKIEMQRAENNVNRMTIKAPMDGIVVMGNVVLNGELRQIREGDIVMAGQPFMTIVDPSSMVLNATVNQVDAERLRLGMRATIRLDAYPDVQLPGGLIGIGAMSKTSTFRANYVGEIPVRLKLEKTDPRVIPDLTGSAEIVMSAETTTVVAPRSAIFDDNGAPVVYIQKGELWEKKKVDLGLASFTHVAVRSGLQKGDVIATERPL
jgi:HlyD family secretion protein